MLLFVLPNMPQRTVTTIPPKIIVFVVYRSKSGLWKGFCSPYDVTCYAHTAEQAKKKLISLVTLYEEGLKKYAYPKPLTFKKLSDLEDRKVFEVVKKRIAEEIREKIAKRYESYQSEGIAQEDFSFNIPTRVIGHYYQPQVA